MHRNDMWRVDLGEDSSLAPKPGVGDAGLRDLDGDGLSEFDVPCLEDDAHAPAADLSDDLIATRYAQTGAKTSLRVGLNLCRIGNRLCTHVEHGNGRSSPMQSPHGQRTVGPVQRCHPWLPPFSEGQRAGWTLPTSARRWTMISRPSRLR